MSASEDPSSRYDFDSDEDDVADGGYDERSKLLNTLPPGISTRSYSINGTQTRILEPPDRYKSRWRSIRVMYLTMFLSSVSFSICVASLYPYLKILDKDADTNYLGWVVAAYSMGQLVASPFFGFWHNCRSKTREPILISLSINILANVLYMYLESIETSPQLFLLLARILIGFGAGNVAVVRSYLSGATTLTERTSTMANMSAFQAVGFIIGPLIQTAMVPIGYPGPISNPAFRFNMYTATGFFGALVGVLNVVLLVVVFREHAVADDQVEPGNIQNVTKEVVDEVVDESATGPDYLAVIPSIALFFSVLFIFAVFETIATAFAMHMFSWTKSTATLYVGLMLGGAGVISIGVLIVIKVLSKRVNERYLLLSGFVFCLLGFLVYLPWGNHYPDIQYAELHSAVNVTNNSWSGPITTDGGYFRPFIHNNNTSDNATNNLLRSSLTERTSRSVGVPIEGGSTKNTSHEAVGCPYYYDWCYTTPAVRLWQFMLGTFFIAIGYPTCNVMSYAIYSKILGPKPQGIWMGWLTAAGSLARTLGPIFVSQVYDAYGPRITFITMISVTFVTIIGLLLIFRKLVPFKQRSYIVVN